MNLYKVSLKVSIPNDQFPKSTGVVGSHEIRKLYQRLRDFEDMRVGAIDAELAVEKAKAHVRHIMSSYTVSQLLLAITLISPITVL